MSPHSTYLDDRHPIHFHYYYYVVSLALLARRLLMFVFKTENALLHANLKKVAPTQPQQKLQGNQAVMTLLPN